MTQDEWKVVLDAAEGGEEITFYDGDSELTVIRDGQIIPHNCDFLARWCLGRCGLKPYGITAPSWGSSFSMGLNSPLRFAYWSLGEDYIGIYVTDPDEELRPPREDGRPRPSYRTQWDRSFIIPNMPVPEWRELPDEWKALSREERRAWRDEKRPRRQLLDALALHAFASWLLKNVQD